MAEFNIIEYLFKQRRQDVIFGMKRIHNSEGYVADNDYYRYFYYYRRDHLGNNREVWNANTQQTEQITNYYPSGTPWVYETAQVQPYMYNGKEFVEIGGYDVFDYGARMRGGAVPRFETIDPLCEKYYSISPYAYCLNNPVKYIDPDGRDGMVTGSGTKEDPYIITANYYYQNGTLNEEQIKGLSSAVSAYNNSGKDGLTEIKNSDGSKSYVRYNLSVEGVDDVGKAVAGNIFTEIDGQDVSYGNAIGTRPNGDGGGDEFGSANGWRVDINPENIAEGIENGFNSEKLLKSTYVHEIGHNLGLDHNDKTSIMENATMTKYERQIGGNTTIYTYPNTDKKGIRIMVNRINTSRVGSLGIIRTR